MSRPKLLAEWFWIERWNSSDAFLLPMVAQGLYRSMLSQAWLRRGRLPCDEEAIRKLTGCSLRDWKTAWPRVKKFWTVSDGDSLVNETQLEVYAQALARHASAAARGQKGAERKAQLQAQRVAELLLKDKPPSPSPSLLPTVEGLPDADAPAPKKRRAKRTPKEPVDDPAPTRAMIEFWQQAEELHGVAPHGDYAMHGRVFRDAWLACRKDVEAVYRAINAFFEDRTDFTITQGHNIKEFKRTLQRWVRIANGMTPLPHTESRTERTYREAAEILERSRHNGNQADDYLPLEAPE